MKKLLVSLLAALTLSICASAAFERVNTYDNNFTDVKETSWYAENVKMAYELGFMNGKSANTFDPNGNVTVVEGITMAARLHAIYNGTEVTPRPEDSDDFRIDFDGDKEIVDMSGHGARNDDGISFLHADGEIVDGVLVVRAGAPLSNGLYDPGVKFAGLNLVAKDYTKLKFRMKRDFLPNTNPDAARWENVQIYFTTSQYPNYTADRCFIAKVRNIDMSEWFEFEVDLTNDNWADTITSIRFDPTDNNGVYYIDYIILEKADDEEAKKDEKWYDMYIDYAVDNHLMENERFFSNEYNRNITRAEMCDLFAAALPEDYFTPINDVKGIPDIVRDSKNADVYLMLYKAGVLLGDTNGNFNAGADIKRSEVAAIINRAAIPENRVKGEVDADWSKQGSEYDLEFDDPSDLDGLSFVASSAKIVNGALVIEAKDMGEKHTPRYDPQITVSNLSIDTSRYTNLKVRMKIDFIDSIDSTRFDFYYKTANDAKFNEVQSVHQEFEAYSYVDPAGWYVMEVDLRMDPDWKGIIDSFRFDPANTNGIYTIDYIRICDSDPYYNASHEVLTANGFTSTELLSDEGFENGFYVAKQDQSVGFNHGKFTDYVETEKEPSWGIAPWWSLYDLIENRDTATDKYTLKDDKGINTVIYNPEEKSISMRVDATKVHNGETHYINHETWWPHLLLEQNSATSVIDKQKNTLSADKMFVELDMRITDFKDTLNTEGENECGYFAYFYLMTDKAPGQRIYFGLNLLGKLTGSTHTTPSWSPESAGQQYMYRIPQAAIFGGVENSFNPAKDEIVVGDEWKSIRLDVTPHIERAIEWANRDNVFGVQVSKEEMYIGGGNIGFEVWGNYDCTVEIKDFNMISYNKD